MSWEWKIVSEESSKNISFPSVLPSDSTSYGGRYVYDDEEPLTRFGFKVIGVPIEACNAIRTAYRSRKTPYTLTDKLGTEHTGYVTGYRFANVDGCNLFEVELELTVVTTELD